MPGGFYTRAQIQAAMEQFTGKKIRGRPSQDIYEENSVQNYVLGSKLKVGDKTFRYSKSRSALPALARLLINANIAPGCTGHEDEDGFEGVLHSAAAIGAMYVDIADTALRAVNYYQGGHFIAYGVTIFHQHEIVASDAGNGTYVRLYLAKPITTEIIAVTYGVTAYLNKYSDVGLAGSGGGVGFETFIGLNLVPITHADYFFWLLTSGLVIVTPTGAPNWPGDAVNLRLVSVNPADGTIQNAKDDDPSLGHQIVGDLAQSTVNTYGDLLINLKLDD